MRRLVRGFFGLVPLTWRGLVLGLVAAGALWFYAHERQDLILAVVGWLAVAALVLGLTVTVIGALATWLRLRSRREGAPLEGECGQIIDSGFVLASPWYAPLSVATWEVEAPSGLVLLRRGRRERLASLRRGEHEQIVRRVSVQDAFGVGRISFWHTEERTLRFVPHTGGLHRIQVVEGMAGGDALPHPEAPQVGDPSDLRNYGDGDPIRFILWKVFARSRQLVVRTPERALAPIQRTVAYLVAGDDDEAAAGAAWVAVRGRALGSTWVLGADGTDLRARDPVAALHVLVASAATPPGGSGAGLQGFLDEVATGDVRRAVIFVPPRPGPWVERVVAAARSTRSRVDVLVCVDGVEPARRLRPSRLVLRAPRRAPLEPPPASRRPLQAVLAGLEGLPGELFLVDRVASVVHPASHLRTLRRR